jgi:hypothetical protein
MVEDSENYRAEDEKHTQTISAQDALEAYCYRSWTAVMDVKMKGKISETDNMIILGKCNGVLCRLEVNQLAEKRLSICRCNRNLYTIRS